ncbi:hypothetical protein GCM10029964_015980 [Kibdelosporangium lantanae]
MPDRVDRDRADAQHGVGFLGGPAHPAQQRTDPRHQLTRAERLGDVVVRAQVQSQQEIVLRGPGGEHQHRQVGLAPQDPAHVQAVHTGQHDVEDQQVGAVPADLVERVPAVVHDHHGVLLAFQVAPDQLGLFGVVLGEDDVRAHDPMIRRFRDSARSLTGP